MNEIQAPPVIKDSAARQCDGPRIACGWSFETLDPAHVDPAKRHFAECTRCHRPYLAIYVQQPSFVCTRVNCGSTSYRIVRIPLPPAPLILSPRRAISYAGGAMATLADQPLGLSSGTIVLDDSESHYVLCRNNSSQSIELLGVPPPVWLKVTWADAALSKSASVDHGLHSPAEAEVVRRHEPGRGLVLAPQHLAMLTFESHPYRPMNYRGVVKLTPEHQLHVQADLEAWKFHLIWIGVWLLAFLHLWLAPLGIYFWILSVAPLVAAVAYLSFRYVQYVRIWLVQSCEKLEDAKPLAGFLLVLAALGGLVLARVIWYASPWTYTAAMVLACVLWVRLYGFNPLAAAASFAIQQIQRAAAARSPSPVK